MSEIPENVIPPEEMQKALENWYKADAELKKLKVYESSLRKMIFKSAFPEPKEGVNDYELPDDYLLKGTNTLERSVDMGALMAITPHLLELKLDPESLLKVETTYIMEANTKLPKEVKDEILEHMQKITGLYASICGAGVANLVKEKTTLAVGAYRKLTEEQTALFDQCLVIKPASPKLSITKAPS